MNAIESYYPTTLKFEIDSSNGLGLEIPLGIKVLSVDIVLHILILWDQSELPRPIPRNQTTDVHRGTTLITRVIT